MKLRADIEPWSHSENDVVETMRAHSLSRGDAIIGMLAFDCFLLRAAPKADAKPQHDREPGSYTNSEIAGTARYYKLTKTEAVISLLKWDASLIPLAMQLVANYPTMSIDKAISDLKACGG